MSTPKNRIWLKLDKVFFGLEKDLFICACYIPPVNSPYYDDNFLKLETEIPQVSDKGNILLIGDLNARIANRSDFIENEDELCGTLQNILPDEYICDFNINRNSVDSVFNSRGQQLLDLCIASQLRVLNGRLIGDMLGNMTCYKPNGTSTVDYALASVDLVNSVNFFQVLDPSYLSDHVQIDVYLNCNMLIPNKNLNYKPNVLKKSYKWEHISKEKLFNVLQVNTVEKLVHYENSDFEKNKVGVENAEQELGKIFESLAQQSCKIIRCFKKNISKKKKNMGRKRVDRFKENCISTW